MAKPRKLRRPPISEALVDLRIPEDPTISVERLRPLSSELVGEYPTVDEKQGVQAELRVEGGKLMLPAVKNLGFQGLWVSSADKKRVAQFRPDGFTLNNIGVGEYMGGDALLNEALTLWSRFVVTVNPPTVVRAALRYLNTLQLPYAEGDDFRRFLNAPVELPEDAPQATSAFLGRIVAHDESTRATVIVTQKLDNVGLAGVPVHILIDVDAFFAEEMSADEATLRSRLEMLRDLKNRTFFALLTDEAVKLFE